MIFLSHVLMQVLKKKIIALKELDNKANRFENMDFTLLKCMHCYKLRVDKVVTKCFMVTQVYNCHYKQVEKYMLLIFLSVMLFDSSKINSIINIYFIISVVQIDEENAYNKLRHLYHNKIDHFDVVSLQAPTSNVANRKAQLIQISPVLVMLVTEAQTVSFCLVFIPIVLLKIMLQCFSTEFVKVPH